MRRMPRIRVIIVDDLAQARQSLRIFLEQMADNLEVVGEATNGFEAVQLAKELGPDIVLMDLDMPVMDGFEASRQIKDWNLAKRVILLTMSGHRSARELAAEVGVDAFVEKTTAVRTLIPAIQGVLGTLSAPAALGKTWRDRAEVKSFE